MTAARAALEMRFEFAREVVRDAGALALRYFRDPDSQGVEVKGLQDVVTIADRAVEDRLRSVLLDEFDADGFLGEERGMSAGWDRTRPLWIVDPIDGTANFARHVPLWCVSVGLVVDGEAALGFVYNPVTDEMHAAIAGGGATLNGASIRVSAVDSAEHARIGLGFSYRRPPAIHVECIRRLLDRRCEYSRLGSGALGMAYVADGRFEGYFEPHINAWDVVAGIALVREAGGWTSDFLAGDALAQGNPILAAAPGVKKFMLDTLWPTLDVA